MGILAVYDTVGIQNYIFASNKLAENVGGSKLVADIFSGMLPETISSITGQAEKKWCEGGELDANLKAEMIYEGGGNAYVAFSDDQTFQNVTEAFLMDVSEAAPGVGIAVAAIETSFGETYESDFERLNNRLALVKDGFTTPVFAGNQPITKQSTRTGLPVSIYDYDEYLSAAQDKKRKRYIDFKKDPTNGMKHINDFSDLAFDKGTDSLIAIIHADGNNIGSRIKTGMKNFKSYSEAVPKIRELSVKISACYRTARERTRTAFNEAYAAYMSEQKRMFPDKWPASAKSPIQTEACKEKPPIFTLIDDGDDTTIVIGGRFAIDFAARLLREIEAASPEENPFADSKPTACAGVVLFHDHYPFSEAYKLAEELCSNAKKPSRACDGSYIDFHLHQSGNVSGLHELRQRQYKVDGKTILCRPWRVSKDGTGETPSFAWFEDNIRAFKDPGQIPNNKSKALRNAIGRGETEAGIAESQMRDSPLPKLPAGPLPSDTSKYAPYFDILELCDAYENLLNKGGDDHAEPNNQNDAAV